MHSDARILCVKELNLKVVLYAEEDINTPIVPRHFYVVGTGHAVPEDAGQYLDTVMFIAPPALGRGLPQDITLHIYDGAKDFVVEDMPLQPAERNGTVIQMPGARQ